MKARAEKEKPKEKEQENGDGTPTAAKEETKVVTLAEDKSGWSLE